MRLENAVAADVLERILSAYGFTMQKELSDKLGIAKSNVASWLQRGQVPGNVLVQCALDTGADVQWLVNGEFANANANKILNIASTSSLNEVHTLNGQPLIRKMLASGGRPVLQRIMEAYGFKTQKELSEYLGISTGTISTWVRRDFFPGDVVITCALDTGVSLEWLATGVSVKDSILSEPYSIPVKELKAGRLSASGKWFVDISFITHNFIEPVLILSNSDYWIADLGTVDITNGRWVLSVDGKCDIYDVVLLPGKKINVVKNGSEFICDLHQVEVKGEVILTMVYN